MQHRTRLSKQQKHLAHSAVTGALMMAIVIFSGSGSVSPSSPSVRPMTAHASRSVRMNMGSLEELRAAMRARTELLQRNVRISFLAETGTAVTVLDLALATHSDWVEFHPDLAGNAKPILNAERIVSWLESSDIQGLSEARDCTIIREWNDAENVRRIETDCTAASGYDFDRLSAAQDIKEALEANVQEIAIAVRSVVASVEGTDGGDNIVRQSLALLATGQSNFKGSGEGRKSNVRKAVNEQINNIVVPEGATFSFNSALGGKVTLAAGWKMALTIFNGTELRPFPGGGICQASTTLYRAALKAGLPIVKQKSHSLYVTYYEKYGVGLDATIFPGHQDLAFVNDTKGPLVIQSYTDGDEAVVNIFGIDDGRSVVLSGPYFASTAPEGMMLNGRPVRKNEIAWQRNVRLQSGDEKQEIFGARYNALPKSLVAKHPATVTQARGTMDVAMQGLIANNR